MISPEQAADESEAMWLARANGEEIRWRPCGWCRFAEEVAGGKGGVCRDFCPVFVVSGFYCGAVPEVIRWFNGLGTAREVYELAVRHRAALIREAYRILKEHGK